MINKCKVQIRMRELYNVIESLKERDGKTVFSTEEIEFSVEYPFWCFYSCNNIFHTSGRLSSLRLSSLTHPLQVFTVCCALGQDLINRVWARKIVQLQLAPSVGRTRVSAGTTVKHGRTRPTPGESSPGKLPTDTTRRVPEAK